MASWLARSLLFSMMLLTTTTRDARADIDGYYCVGAGFIAVEFRSSDTRGLSGPHVLRVARFDAELGPRWTGEVIVDGFATHTLACGAKTILFEGAGDRGGFFSYVIQIDSTGSPRILSQSFEPRYAFKAFPTGPKNIGSWAPPGITRLPARASYPRFQLRVTQTNRRVAGGMQHHMRSVLEEIDQSGQVRRSLVISEGTRLDPDWVPDLML